MRHFFSLLLLACTFSLVPQLASAESADELAIRLKGWILLQVEDHGEAWYVRPSTLTRTYMKDGATAYDMMRSFGLGITSTDLNAVPLAENTDALNATTSICAFSEIANRLRGEILLQVEEHGEAWYVHPEKCLRMYLKDGDAAYEIMRFLGLGITNADLARVAPAEVLARACGTDLSCIRSSVENDLQATAMATANIVLLDRAITSEVLMHHYPAGDDLFELHRTVTDYVQHYTEDALQELRDSGRTEEEIQMDIAELEADARAVIGSKVICTYDDKQDMLDQLDAWISGSFSTEDMGFAECENVE